MRFAALAGAALTCALAAVAVHRSRPAGAAMDGLLTREEALAIVGTPLENTLGCVEAERVRSVAAANALLEHCGVDWEPLFRLLTSYHRHQHGRPEADMNRITVWHGFWKGRAQAALRRDRPTCDKDMRRAAIGNAAREAKAFPTGESS